MKPILLIHGYSSEGKTPGGATAADIYGTLPADLRKEFGRGAVKELNLSRWISLSDGIRIDDISYAMDRALKSSYPQLLKTGFHVVIHSTGALVVRRSDGGVLFSQAPDRSLVPASNAKVLMSLPLGERVIHSSVRRPNAKTR